MDKKNLNKEVERTLNSLDTVERAETKPFFFGRLEHKLKEKPQTQGELKWYIGLAMVLVLVVFNVFSYLSYWPSSVGAEEGVELLADEYGIDYLDIYSQEED